MTDASRGTVLVTGGAGYIGSHMCKALARSGYMPVTYDNLAHGHEWAVKWGPLERGDILDPVRLSEVMTRHSPFAVIHFAAFAYVGESVSNPAKYYRNNVVGSQMLLDVMRAHDVEKIVFSSSCATYGVPESMPITEDTLQRPINPYGTSKFMVEQMLADYTAAYRLKGIALRYFNAAGADPDGEIGEDHAPETHLIPLVLEAAAGKRPDVTIFGDDYDTPDGTCVRDYVHVSDLADAHLMALRKLETGTGFDCYNLGNGDGVSVAHVIEVAREVTQRDIRVNVGARRRGDPAILVANSSKARQDLGWSPKNPRLADMIGTAWNWSLRNR